MMNAGKRDRRITFERSAPVRTALGVKPQTSWILIGSRLANIRFGTGAERREAAVEAAVQPATFRTLADNFTTTVTVGDRIGYAGLVYDIAGITPIGRGPAEFEFTAVAARG